MTERSGFFTDDLTDGGPYSSAVWELVFSLLFKTEDPDRAVIFGFRNAFSASSPGADQVAIATGAGCTDGTWYESDDVVTHDDGANRPSVGTTGKRIVLRKSKLTGGVRQTIIRSADGTSTLPALTQDSTYHDAPLWSFTHATNGTIAALTDEREYLPGGDSMDQPNPISSYAAIERNIGRELTPNNGAWPSANQAIYIPFVVTKETPVKRVAISNGGVAAGNVDVGIYTADTEKKPSTRLASTGSTAMSGTTAVQIINITDITLQPGLYFIGFVASSTSAEFTIEALPAYSATAPTIYEAGVWQQTSALPLPATATPSRAAVSAPQVFLLSDA